MMDSPLSDEIKHALEKKRYSEMTPEEKRIVIYNQMESIPYNDLTEKPKPKMDIDFDIQFHYGLRFLIVFLLLFLYYLL